MQVIRLDFRRVGNIFKWDYNRYLYRPIRSWVGVETPY